MPIYENRRNAENLIKVDKETAGTVVAGLHDVAASIASILKENSDSLKRAPAAAFDGWYGVEWTQILEALSSALRAKGLEPVLFSSHEIFQAPEEIARYKQQWLTGEPGFGRVNSNGRMQDILDSSNAARLKREIAAAKEKSAGSAVIVYGPGSQSEALEELYDLTFYFDKTADPTLWKMWNGELVPFGHCAPRKDYGWKEYYYCDFYLLQSHKSKLLEKADYYLEAVEAESLKLMPRKTLEIILEEMSKQPLKQVKTYSPGPWGAYRYKDLWDIPGLENNAWNRLAGADLSILIQIAPGKLINMPTTNLLSHNAKRFVGARMAKECPGLIPIEVWLDDGYFPEPQPAERISMPIHNHPGSGYVKRNFNEPLGRYETYYIVEAYEGANTWMGFKEEADIEQWEEKCRKSWEDQRPIEDWKDFIANWKTNVGDLFLIPPGTTHGHGGNQMILEMDTCPSVAGAEYSFFGYDFMRPTWDDKKKSMTGKPMSMHLDRYFDNDKFCREKWVKDHLRAKPEVVKWTKDYVQDRYSTCGPMPFEIERLHFDKRAECTTQGKFLHAATLTVGSRVKIRSKSDPSREAEIEKFQCALIPAGFGDYELLNLKEGHSTVVLWRLKQG